MSNDAQHRLALPAGYELGRYRFQEVLGSGGFGITYLAEDKTLGRRVAIKELLPNDIATRIDGTTVVAKTQSEEESLSWARERFVGEGRALAACDHPNVVNVYEMVEANGTAYMITKYEEGHSLEQWLRNLGRSPNETELRNILMPLLSGLETVHKAGFLHRDIKPENIYITNNGRPVLLDFGSARQAITNRSVAMTSIVTSGYAPFEQYHEDGNQGAWSDIYALGAVAYRAITGKKPPEATRRLKDDPIEKLTSRYAGQYDAQFLRAIDKALTVDEKKRPQTIAEWQKMLGTGERLPLDSDATRLMPRVAKGPAWLELVRGNPALIGGAAGGVLLLLLVFLIAGHKSQPSPNAAVQPSPTPGGSSPGPQPSASSGSTTDISPGPSIVPGLSPGPQSAGAAIDPRLAGTWEAKITWPPPGQEWRDVAGTWKQPDNTPWTFSPDGTFSYKDVSGKVNGQWQHSDGKIVAKTKLTINGEDASTTYQLALSPDGKTLSGDWSNTKMEKTGQATFDRVATESGSRAKQIRWQQEADGHYTFSGPISETGVITPAGEGKFQAFANNSKKPVDLSYEFKGEKLLTTGPMGALEWKRVGSGTSKRSSSGSSEQSDTRPGSKVHHKEKDFRHNLIKRAFRHFP